MAAAVFGGTLTLAQTETQPSAVASRQQHYAVMALAWGYPPSAYAAFLGSLRRTGYSGAILLFEPLPTGSSARRPQPEPSKVVADIIAMHGATVQRVEFPRDVPLYVAVSERLMTEVHFCENIRF